MATYSRRRSSSTSSSLSAVRAMGKIAVGGPDDEHRVPLLALGRVRRGEDERVVLVVAADGEVLRVGRRFERERGEERGAIGIAGGDDLQLVEVGQPRRRVVVGGLEDRIVQLAHQPDGLAPAPARSPGACRRAARPGPAAPAARATARAPRRWPSAAHSCCASSSTAARAVASPTPGRSRSSRYQLTSSRGFSSTRRKASMSLTCAASRNLRPPHFSYGMRRLASSISRSADR